MPENIPLILKPAPLPAPGTFTAGARTFGSKTSGSQAPGRYAHGRYSPNHYAPQADIRPATADLPPDLPVGRRASDKLLDTLIQHEINYAHICHDTARFFADQQFPGLFLLLDTQAKHARLFARQLTQHRTTPQPQDPSEANTPDFNATDHNTPDHDAPDHGTHHTNIDAFRIVQLQCRIGKHLADQLAHELINRGYSPLPKLLHAHYHPSSPDQLWAINFIQNQPTEAMSG